MTNKLNLSTREILGLVVVGVLLAFIATNIWLIPAVIL